MKSSQQRTGATPLQDSAAFPRRHLLIAAGCCSALILLVAMAPGSSSAINRQQIPLKLPLQSDLSDAPAQQSVEDSVESWNDVAVEPGDNLSVLFARAGFSDKDVFHIVKYAPGGKSLTRLFPGEKIGFLRGAEGELSGLKRVKSRLETEYFFRESGNAYRHDTETREPDIHRSFASATITSSLFLAGQKAGLPQALIMELANIFGGVVDFVLDPRSGDTFHVVYEELYLDGEKFANGSILAAEFVNRGNRYTAYRYLDETNRPGYFSEEGVSMRRQFMLAPVDFTRISSNFNPRRLHPIYKTSRPHRGTDYAAPRGTPVFAAGDGRVVEAGYTRANGNYVVLQHGEAYTTKYLHLHKRNVRKGERVVQNEVIGTVGSTGAATGPHLHYEFLLNGVHRNPRTIHKKLPKAKSLSPEEMPRFVAQTQSFQMQLATIRQQQLALRRTETAGDGG